MSDIKSEINLITNTQVKSNTFLSPFTWSNIKFPPINKLTNKQQNNSKSKQAILEPIKQKKKGSLQLKHNPNQKNQKEKKKINKNKNNKTNETSIDLTSINFESIQTKLTEKQKGKKLIFRSKAKSQIQKLNKTIEIARAQQRVYQGSKQQQMKRYKKVRYLDQKNNMEQYMKNNLLKAGWQQQKDKTISPTGLLWANIGKLNDFNDIKQGQYYNHLNGSHLLTNKDKLHEHLSVRGQHFYPKSYTIPKEYDLFAQENNKISIKCMLKQISKQILQFLNNPLEKIQLFEVTLYDILQSSINKTNDEQVHYLIKLCSYLQTIRLEQGYNNYFQNFQNYNPANIKTKQNFYNNLLGKAYHYLQKKSTEYIKFSFYDIDYRVIMLILHYHYLFNQKDLFYVQDSCIWIIKPIASSRGAGISLVRSSKQFCSDPESMFFEFKNRKKYENKIIQQYISNPLLLQNPPQFSNKKFDIRQWVLVLSFKNKPEIYKYHTAYCRFSQQKFTLNKLSNIFKQSSEKPQESIMMLEDLYSNITHGDLRNKYNQQIDYIIKQSIISCKSIKYQKGCFELFGFDFFVDQNQKVYLLQINLNPSCSSERHPVLKQEAETMSLTMMDLVMESKQSDKWIKIHGSKRSQFQNELSQQIDEQSTQIKPYYQTNIDKQSLIAYIQNRQKILSFMYYLVQKSIYYNFFNKLKPINRQISEIRQEDPGNSQKIDQKPTIIFIQQKSVTNLSVT